MYTCIPTLQAFTYACCNAVGPAYPGGGIWVVEPSQQLYNDITDLIAGPVPGTPDGVWHWGEKRAGKARQGRQASRQAGGRQASKHEDGGGGSPKRAG